MAKNPDDQQKTDARRIGDAGSGKLDQRDRPARPEASDPETIEPHAGLGPPLEATHVGSARERLQSDRQAAIEQLRALGISPNIDDSARREGTDVVRDEGDAAQASERQDMNFATRERLAARINQLTAALERIEQGGYGTCVDCGGLIEAARLTAVPESERCLTCQETRERATRREAAA